MNDEENGIREMLRRMIEIPDGSMNRRDMNIIICTRRM